MILVPLLSRHPIGPFQLLFITAALKPDQVSPQQFRLAARTIAGDGDDLTIAFSKSGLFFGAQEVFGQADDVELGVAGGDGQAAQRRIRFGEGLPTRGAAARRMPVQQFLVCDVGRVRVI